MLALWEGATGWRLDPERGECVAAAGYALLTLASIYLATHYYLPSLLTYLLGLRPVVIG